MKTLAQKLIEEKMLRQRCIALYVVPMPDANVPEEYLAYGEQGDPVRFDLFSDRPLNLEYKEDGLYVDLCFYGNGIPDRCFFRWESIISVDEVSTIAMIVCALNEDGSVRQPNFIQGFGVDGDEEEPPKSSGSISHLSLVR